MKRKLEAVIFDLDGVITDTAECHFLGWKQLADELGLQFDRAKNERLRGIDRMESLEIVLEGSGMTFSRSRKEAMAAKKNGYYLAHVAKLTPAALLPGISRLLDDLGRARVKTAVASASKNAQMVLENLGLKDSFDVVVDGNQVKRGKPDPELFLTAAQRLGIPPANCIGIEDALAGIQAIKAAGMLAAGIGPATRTQGADIVLASTEELTLSRLENLMEAQTNNG